MRKILFISIFVVVSVAFSEKYTYQILPSRITCTANYYLNDVLIFSSKGYNIKNSNSARTYVHEYLMKKNNVLRIELKAYFEGQTDFGGASATFELYRVADEGEKIVDFNANYGNINHIKEAWQREKPTKALTLESMNPMKTVINNDDSITTIIFDVPELENETLPWLKNEKYDLTAEDQEKIKNKAMELHGLFLKKDQAKIKEKLRYKSEHLDKSYGNNTGTKRLNYVLEAIFNEMIASPFPLEKENLEIIQIGNNLFQVKQKKEDYIVRVPLKNIDEEDAKKQDNLRKYSLCIFVSKIDNEWRIIL